MPVRNRQALRFPASSYRRVIATGGGRPDYNYRPGHSGRASDCLRLTRARPRTSANAYRKRQFLM